MKKAFLSEGGGAAGLLRPEDQDTIGALASPPGTGAIALIRISGKEALKKARKLLTFLPVRPLSHHLYFGPARCPQNKEPLDEVLVSYFQKGKSFTGEESLEISCHGSPFLVSRILRALGQVGVRSARPGEFSYRSFLNGKRDLIQVESVLSLIHSRTPSQNLLALKGLSGQLSEQFQGLEKKLIRLLSHLEASLDFSEEDIDPFSEQEQKQMLKALQGDVFQWLKRFEQSRQDREGTTVVLSGAPNAGKSSLFNSLIDYPQAIVSPQAGTTRDIVSATRLWGQREILFKDTAGLRPRPCSIERQGIQKALQEIKTSNLNLFLVESRWPLPPGAFFKMEDYEDGPHQMWVFSKADLLKDSGKRKLLLQEVHKKWKKLFKTKFQPVWLSVKTGEGMDTLKTRLQEFVQSPQSVDQSLLTVRQFETMKKVHHFLNRALKLLNQNKGGVELVAFELKEALRGLKELSGKEYTEEVIANIFKEFCIGK